MMDDPPTPRNMLTNVWAVSKDGKTIRLREPDQGLAAVILGSPVEFAGYEPASRSNKPGVYVYRAVTDERVPGAV